MPVQITILGLGQIGASIGMSLASQKESFHRVGHDISLENARQAEKLGAVDEVRINLPASIEKAEVVILALPFDQVEATLKLIAPDLKQDCVILDTAPVKQDILGKIHSLIPDHSYYVGFVPALSPRYLLSSDAGLAGAQPNLFQKGLFVIANTPGIPSAAIQLAVDMAGLLGAAYLFAEAAEVDSQMAALHLLPQITAGALVQTTIDQPGWREGRKMASRPYTWATQNIATMESPAAVAHAAIHNRTNFLRVLDTLIAQLNSLRDMVAQGEQESLAGYLKSAAEKQDAWWKERTAGDWANEEQTPAVQVPSSTSWLGTFFGLRPRSKK